MRSHYELATRMNVVRNEEGYREKSILFMLTRIIRKGAVSDAYDIERSF